MHRICPFIVYILSHRMRWNILSSWRENTKSHTARDWDRSLRHRMKYQDDVWFPKPPIKWLRAPKYFYAGWDVSQCPKSKGWKKKKTANEAQYSELIPLSLVFQAVQKAFKTCLNMRTRLPLKVLDGIYEMSLTKKLKYLVLWKNPGRVCTCVERVRGSVIIPKLLLKGSMVGK